MIFRKNKKRINQLENEIMKLKLSIDSLQIKLEITRLKTLVDEWMLFSKNWDMAPHEYKYKGDIKEITNREQAAQKGFRYLASAGSTEVWGK